MTVSPTPICVGTLAPQPIRSLQRPNRQKSYELLSTIIFCALHFAFLFALVHAAEADDFKNSPAYRETWEKSQSVRPQPSINSTPVPIEVGSSTYRIPRNYLTYMPIPTIKVTIPGYPIAAFKPLTEETRECFGSILQGQQAGCRSIEFRLGVGVDPRIAVENLLKGLSNVRSGMGPYGYHLYKFGVTELYTKDDGGHFIESNCSIFVDTDRRAATCTSTFTLNDGHSVQFFSSLDQLDIIPDIAAGMRQLMATFKAKDSQP